MLISVPANGYNSSISRTGGGKPIKKGKRESNIFLETGSHLCTLAAGGTPWVGNDEGKTGYHYCFADWQEQRDGPGI